MTNLFVIRPKGMNIGNDVINIALRNYIDQAFGKSVNLIALPATSRYDSEAHAGLTAKSIYEINQYGHGVIVGGGNLYENGELDVDVEALSKLEVPLMLFSLSRGRIYSRRGRLVPRTDTMPDSVISALESKASVSLPRDEATAQYLRNLGFPEAEVGGCPTLFLNRVVSQLPPKLDEYGNTVFISVRNPALMNIPLALQARVHDEIRATIAMLWRRGERDIRLLCHDRRDLAFAASFRDMPYLFPEDGRTFLNVLRSCRLNITYRLHSFLPCLSFGVPAVKLSYDERGLSLIDTVGFGKWNIDIVTSPDPVREVSDRIDDLAQLQKIRRQTTSIWKQLDNSMSQGFRRFREEVDDWKRITHSDTRPSNLMELPAQPHGTPAMPGEVQERVAL
jgi:hypothetical protein